MTKHVAIDESRLKAAVRAVQERKRPDQARVSNYAQIVRLEHDLGNRLEPLFVDAGLDVKKIQQIRTEHHTELRRILEAQKADTAKEIAARAHIVQRAIENKKKALELLANKAYLTTPITISTPITIISRPTGIVSDSHIEPFNNWARLSQTVRTEDPLSGESKLSFLFAWQNPSNFLAVINCNSDLILNGIAQAHAWPPGFSQNRVHLNLFAQLNVFLGETEIDRSNFINTLFAYSSWIFGEHDLDQMNFISADFKPSSEFILVEADQTVVFEVTFDATYTIDTGDIVLDFDGSPVYKIMCPALNIDLLTPPSAAKTKK